MTISTSRHGIGGDGAMGRRDFLKGSLTAGAGLVAGPFARLAPPPPPMTQDWLPIKAYGGYQKHAALDGLALATPRGPRSYPLAIADSGPWMLDCRCGAF